MRAHEVLAARQELGMTQAALGRALELGGADDRALSRTVRNWESGRVVIPGPVGVAIRLMLEKARPKIKRKTKGH
jgi:DNA-binding transcriptional regulator YiaG